MLAFRASGIPHSVLARHSIQLSSALSALPAQASSFLAKILPSSLMADAKKRRARDEPSDGSDESSQQSETEAVCKRTRETGSILNDERPQRVVAKLVIGGETYDVVTPLQEGTSEGPLHAAVNSNTKMVRFLFR